MGKARRAAGPAGAQWPAAKVEQWPLSDLVPSARNARRHPPEQIEQLARLIERFGWTMPVLCRENGEIIAGHGRVLAAERLGIEEVPVVVARGWSDDQCRAYMLADNRIAESATWDDDLLRMEIAHLLEAGDDVGALGFSQREIDMLLTGADASGGAGGADPDADAPEPPPDPVTRPGDVWRLGEHRLLCGDATSAADVERLLAGRVPHLMVTDPPYGVDYDPSWRNRAGVSKSRRTGRVSNDTRADWREAWALFPGSVAYVWHGALHAGTVEESLKASGFAIRSQIIWTKPHFAIGRGHYHWQHEPLFYAVRKGGSHWQGGRDQATVWAIGARDEDATTVHGTQKPVECMRRPMLNNSARGDLVYEPFMGSGTTLIAAELVGRVCFGVELDPAYVDVAVERWQRFTGQEAVLDGDGRTFAQVRTERLGDDAAPPADPPATDTAPEPARKRKTAA